MNKTAFGSTQILPCLVNPSEQLSQLAAFPLQVLHSGLQTSHFDAINEDPDVKKYPSAHDVHEVASTHVVHYEEQAVQVLVAFAAEPVERR